MPRGVIVCGLVLDPGDTISGNSEVVLIWEGMIEMVIQPFVCVIFFSYRRTTQLNFNGMYNFSEKVYRKQWTEE